MELCFYSSERPLAKTDVKNSQWVYIYYIYIHTHTERERERERERDRERDNPHAKSPWLQHLSKQVQTLCSLSP